MIPTRSTSFVLLLGALSLGACKKEANKKTSCTASIYGYEGVPGTPDTTILYSCTMCSISTTTAAATAMGSALNNVMFNQGAYNAADNCYYTFKYGTVGATDTLYRISSSASSSGVITRLATTVPSSVCRGLVYNRFTGKLYCLRTASGVSHIAELSVGSSTFSITDLATTLYPEAHDNATVDNSTGDIYYQSYQAGSGYVIEKYHPGAAAPSTVVVGMPVDLWGLRFNVNDNMLYAIGEGLSGYEFKKISSSGTISVLATLSFDINYKFTAATIDPCSNHYIFARKESNTSTGHLYQLDMSGAIIQHDVTGHMYQGLDVNY